MYNQAYNFNPYMQPRYNQPQIQQPMPTVNENLPTNLTTNLPNQRTSLLGRVVDGIEVVRASEIPMDGSTSYFPISDGSAIVTKQLQMDGTSKITIYKPIEETNKETPKYVTLEDFNKELNKIDLSEIDDLKEEIKDLKQEIKDLKKKKKDD